MEAQVERRGVAQEQCEASTSRYREGGAASDKDQKLWLVRLQLGSQCALMTPNTDTPYKAWGRWRIAQARMMTP
jgi:hypothetical protein